MKTPRAIRGVYFLIIVQLNYFNVQPVRFPEIGVFPSHRALALVFVVSLISKLEAGSPQSQVQSFLHDVRLIENSATAINRAFFIKKV